MKLFDLMASENDFLHLAIEDRAYPRANLTFDFVQLPCERQSTVTIRTNLTGNSRKNTFCFCSSAFHKFVPFLFYNNYICSVPVPFPFRSLSHTHSVFVPFLFTNLFPVRFLLISTVQVVLIRTGRFSLGYL